MKNIILLAATLLLMAFTTGPTDKFIGQPVTDELLEQILGVKAEYGGAAVAYNEGNVGYCVTYYSDNPQKILITLQKSVDNNREVTLLDYIEIDRATLNKNASIGMDWTYGDEQNLIILFYDHTELAADGDYPEWYTKIYKAWTIDKETKKLVEIAVQGLKHYNEGYGA